MKLCALIYRGQVVEVSTVKNDHDFGEHGNHFHIEVNLVEEHMCKDGPIIWTGDEDIDEC